MKTMVVAVLHPREHGGYDCRVPDFPGCVTSGRTIEEAVDMVNDAANLWACDIETDGRPQPVITPYLEVEHEPNDILQILSVDTVEYRQRTDTRAVRKNVSMPAWMAYQADKRGINCSQLLQDALKKALA